MDRVCGECTVCCRIPEIKEKTIVIKPAHVACPKITSCSKGSCGIFKSKERPSVCGSYECSWKRGFGKEEDRPNLNGMMMSVSTMNGGTWVFGVEDKPNALRTTGRDIVLDIANKIDMPIIIVRYESKPPTDKGDEVIVKPSLMPRADKLINGLIDYLDQEKTIGIYRLRVN
jgi:hypothetical protein